MLRSIQKLIGDKRKQLIFPIFLMSLDAIGSLVMYLMLYFTVIHLLNGSLTGGLVRNYTIVCLISIILRLIIYRSGYFLCFSRGAEMCIASESPAIFNASRLVKRVKLLIFFAWQSGFVQ